MKNHCKIIGCNQEIMFNWMCMWCNLKWLEWVLPTFSKEQISTLSLDCEKSISKIKVDELLTN
jgi:hypothetical protein